MSEFEGIPLQEVFKIPVVQYLNDLNYLKHKKEYEAELQKRLMKNAH